MVFDQPTLSSPWPLLFWTLLLHRDKVPASGTALVWAIPAGKSLASAAFWCGTGEPTTHFSRRVCVLRAARAAAAGSCASETQTRNSSCLSAPQPSPAPRPPLVQHQDEQRTLPISQIWRLGAQGGSQHCHPEWKYSSSSTSAGRCAWPPTSRAS